MKPMRNSVSIQATGAALVLGACTTTGMGGGELTRQGQAEEPVLFSWKSGDGGISGSMVATLPDATYQAASSRSPSRRSDRSSHRCGAAGPRAGMTGPIGAPAPTDPMA